MVSVKNVSKSFGDKKVLESFSHDFEGLSCVMGGSGVGKTTLARIIAGLTKPDFGSVSISGHLSFMFQEDRLLLRESMITNLLFVRNDPQRARELLTALGLTEHNKRTQDLSGGMRRRVALARTLMLNHDVLLLDEPFKGLDQALKQSALDLIKHQNKTTIIITHDISDAKYLDARLVFVN